MRCDFDLPDLQTVRGRVVDSEGKPLQEWNVRAADAPIRDFKRQALHAERLELAHPASGKHASWSSEPPPDLRELINALRSTHDTRP